MSCRTSKMPVASTAGRWSVLESPVGCLHFLCLLNLIVLATLYLSSSTFLHLLYSAVFCMPYVTSPYFWSLLYSFSRSNVWTISRPLPSSLHFYLATCCLVLLRFSFRNLMRLFMNHPRPLLAVTTTLSAGICWVAIAVPTAFHRIYAKKWAWKGILMRLRLWQTLVMTVLLTKNAFLI